MWEVAIATTLMTLNTCVVAFVLYRVVTASVRESGEVAAQIAERLLNPYRQETPQPGDNPQEAMYLSTSDPREIAGEDWAPGPHSEVQGPGWTTVDDPLTPGPGFENQ